jgi:cytochrome bd ubiquinol oxidase subunit I
MKLAAMEALWETEQPASFSLFSAINQREKTSSREIKVPVLLSVLANNNTSGEVKGLNELQREAEAKYGPGDYLPPVAMTYWSFRIMVGLGLLFIAISVYGFWLWWRGKLETARPYLGFLTLAMFLPYLANSTGWMVTEFGRQPWIVQGLMRTAQGVSPNVSAPMVLVTMLGFTAVYAVLIVLEVGLLRTYARMGLDGRPAPKAVNDLGGVHIY